MCERCDAWEIVIDNWFGGCLLQTLELYVDQCLEEMNAHTRDGHRAEDPTDSEHVRKSENLRARGKLACLLLASADNKQI